MVSDKGELFFSGLRCLNHKIIFIFLFPSLLKVCISVAMARHTHFHQKTTHSNSTTTHLPCWRTSQLILATTQGVKCRLSSSPVLRNQGSALPWRSQLLSVFNQSRTRQCDGAGWGKGWIDCLHHNQTAYQTCWIWLCDDVPLLLVPVLFIPSIPSLSYT